MPSNTNIQKVNKKLPCQKTIADLIRIVGEAFLRRQDSKCIDVVPIDHFLMALQHHIQKLCPSEVTEHAKKNFIDVQKHCS